MKSNPIRIIPRLDVKSDRLVKGVQLEGLKVLGKPEDFATKYYEEGADEILYLDTVASLYGRNSLEDIVLRTAEKIFIPLTVGGGIRTLDDVTKMMRSGADRVAINTVLFQKPDLINAIVDSYGSQAVVGSVQAKKMENGTYECLVDGGRERTGKEVLEWVDLLCERGIGELMVTSVDNEGTGKGYDLELMKKITSGVDVPVIACGGAGNKGHLLELIEKSDVDSVCLASVIHFESLPNHNRKLIPKGFSPSSIKEIKAFLKENNVRVRSR